MTKKLTTIVLIACLSLCGIMYIGTAEALAKTKKPSKASLKLKVYDKTQITLKYSAKNAKKYEIQRKFGKGKWKKFKTLKAKKLRDFYIGAKNKRVYFRVRGVNGKKKGKWSKTKSAYYYYKPLKYKVGDTMSLTLKNGVVVSGFKITEAEAAGDVNDGTENYWGKKDGKPFWVQLNRKTRVPNHIEWGDFCDATGYGNGIGEDGKYHPWTLKKSGEAGWLCYLVGVWEEDMNLYYTFDWTEPQVGQEDKWGDKTGYYKPQFASKIQTRGTVSYKDGLQYIGKNDVAWEENYGWNPYLMWVKVYKGNNEVGMLYVNSGTGA